MLALKKMELKKVAVYVIVLAVIFGITGYLIYKNFLAGAGYEGPLNTAADSVVQSENMSGKTPRAYEEGELDFLTGAKFQKLKDQSEPIIIDEARSKDLFNFSD